MLPAECGSLPCTQTAAGLRRGAAAVVRSGEGMAAAARGLARSWAAVQAGSLGSRPMLQPSPQLLMYGPKKIYKLQDI